MNEEQKLVLSLLDKYISDNAFIQKVVNKCWRGDKYSMSQGDPPWVFQSSLETFYVSEFAMKEDVHESYSDDELTLYSVSHVPIRCGTLTGEL